MHKETWLYLAFLSHSHFIYNFMIETPFFKI